MGDVQVERVCAKISEEVQNMRVIKYAHSILHKNCDFLQYGIYHSF
jgi:hypothetical protein